MSIYLSVFLLVGRSVCLSAFVYLSESVYLDLSLRSVCVCRPASIYLSASVLIYLCGLAAKLFCATSYFPGAAPSKSPVKQHTDTNHSVMSVRWFAGTFRSSAGGLTFRWRPAHRQFIAAATRDHNSRGISMTYLWTRNVLIPDVCPATLFQSSYRLSPKVTWVLMSYDVSFVLWLISYVLSYVLYHMVSWLWFMSCF